MIHNFGVINPLKDIEDVKSGVYEGGSVLWECSIDLINYLKDTKIQYNHSKVLDLGCGQGKLLQSQLLCR